MFGGFDCAARACASGGLLLTSVRPEGSRRMRGLGLFSLIIAGTLVSTTAFAKSDHPIGVWGGEHAGVDFQGGLSDVQFDCASGTIDDAVYPARDASFP